MDVFVNWQGLNADELAAKLNPIEKLCNVKLSMITNRGIKVWPDGFPETFCTDHWRCRMKPKDGLMLPKKTIAEILTQCELLGIDTIKTENLYEFDGKSGFSLGQGQ